MDGREIHDHSISNKLMHVRVGCWYKNQEWWLIILVYSANPSNRIYLTQQNSGHITADTQQPDLLR
jgi:hypothetical protein